MNPSQLNVARCGLAWLVAGLLLPATVALAGKPMAFQSLTIDDGLSQSTVNASLQDSSGFIWLATESGLNRYDGYTVTRYLRDRDDPHSLASDFVWALAEDAAGNLWLATDGAGLVRWHRGQERFETLMPVAQMAAEPARRQARSVTITSDGSIWLGTRGAGLLRFNSQGREIAQYTVANAGLASDVVSALQVDPTGGLWIGSDGGVQRLDLAKLSFQTVALVPAGATAPSISSLALDAMGRLWVGSFEAGLFRRDADEAAPRHFGHDPEQADSLSSDAVRAVFVDTAGRVWIATQNGLNLFQPESDDFARYQHRDGDPYSLADNRLMSISQDRTGLLWIGSRAGGVSRWNPRSWTLGGQTPDLLAGAAVLAFADASDGAVWIGSYGAPLFSIDRAGRLQEKFTPEFGYPELGDAPVTALLRDDREQLWIGTMGGGLHRYQTSSAELRSLRHDPQRSDSLSADGIMSLLQAQDGAIWVGSFGGGLNRVDAVTLEVTRVSLDGDASAVTRVSALAQGADGRIWVGTDGAGLGVLEPQSGKFHRVGRDLDRPGSLGSDTVYALHIDSSGRLWVGTAGAGLAALSPSEQQAIDPSFISWSTAQGFSSNVIYGIRSAPDGALWLSSTNGLMRFSSATGQVTPFHRAQGVSSEEFNFGAHYQAPDGRMVFGGTAGFNAFDPAAVVTADTAPTLVLTGFEKFNQPASVGGPYADLRQLRLRHDDDVITFEYAALDFTQPARNRYSVMLQGFDRDWSQPSERRRSTYTNLDAGDYVFRVRGANSDGVWSAETLDIALRIPAAPWASPLAYAAYLLIAVAALTAFLRWRLYEQMRDARIRQLAFYDAVTGLPNREMFDLRADEALQRARQDEQNLDIICLRIGPMKQLGDSLGRNAADDVLRELTTRVSQIIFGSGGNNGRRDLARLNDDSLVAFIRYHPGQDDGMVWARRLVEAVSVPLAHAGHRVVVPGYAGVAGFPADSGDVTSLINFASAATQSSQSAPTNHVCHYEPLMTERSLQRLDLEGDLRHALAHDELALYLQGKFAASGALQGAEALCRWTHPALGPIPPGEFVPLAEQSDLIVTLDEWMLRQVCQVLHQRRAVGEPALAIAVNVSATTFSSGQLKPMLARCAAGLRFDPGLLELEITESAVVRDVDSMIDCLREVNAMGHRLSLDDFGTGYSSLVYLQRFAVDKLKIDRCFVTDLETRSDQRSLCRTIIALAKSMGLQTVAEGVENAQQQKILAQLGCDQLQGFFLHRPEPVAAFLQRMAAEQALSGAA